ncbi:MAG TPA: YidC/Oxa1 family membrane protein insertase [Candidatus Bathyarchaeia archaeon]|nr:YidC/Oxa1 family membrane protein insertase [Candidatus Bathyarchaeia archaeon]
MWHTLLYQPLLNGLIFFYRILGNLGLAIILMTFLLRVVLFPLTLPTLKAAQKIKKLTPEIEKLKKKYGKDKKGFAKAQLELYRREGANPAAGCLPQIVQLLVLVAFFQAFNQVLRADGDIIAKLNSVLYSSLKLPAAAQIETRFLYLDLTKPDFFILGKLKLPGFFLLGAAITQFLSSKLMAPSVSKSKRIASQTPGEFDDVAVAMQKQSLYLMPIMTIMFGLTFPAGLVLYWLIFSLTTLIQQLWLNKSENG